MDEPTNTTIGGKGAGRPEKGPRSSGQGAQPSRRVRAFYSALTEEGWTYETPARVPNSGGWRLDAHLRHPGNGTEIFAELLDYGEAEADGIERSLASEPALREATILLVSRGVLAAVADNDARESRTKLEWTILRNGKSRSFSSTLRSLADNVTRLVGQLSSGRAYASDGVRFVMDQPSPEDLLGRQAFTEALALRLKRIVERGAKENADAAFMVNLQAPWGAGKTTVLNYLRKATEREWVQVQFNAWQNQHVTPPWWTLLDHIYVSAATQTRNPLRWLWLRVTEYAWRLTTERLPVVAALLLAVAAACGLAFVIYRSPATFGIPADSGAVSLAAGLLSLVGTLWGASIVLARGLFSCSSGAARSFVERGRDPMRRIKEHFRKMVVRVGRPILVTIDDIDRCNRGYVIDLLEGIQTLFRFHSVVYVVAGDKRWISRCFSKTYEEFSATIDVPGKGIGDLFIEKAFQLTIALPSPSEERKKKYWETLVTARSAAALPDKQDALRNAEKELEEATSEEEIANVLAKSSDPAISAAIGEAAVLNLARQDVEKSTEHFLLDFASYLEPNPRSMKRLVNAYGINRDLAIISGLSDLSQQVRQHLALWTILCMRWPSLEDALVDDPKLADKLAAGDTAEVPLEVRSLFESPAVQRFFRAAAPGEIKLDSAAVLRLAILSPRFAG